MSITMLKPLIKTKYHKLKDRDSFTHGWLWWPMGSWMKFMTIPFKGDNDIWFFGVCFFLFNQNDSFVEPCLLLLETVSHASYVTHEPHYHA